MGSTTTELREEIKIAVGVADSKISRLLGHFRMRHGDVEQAVGRILRKQQDVYPIVIDLVDRFSIFNAQGMKRRGFYSKNKNYIKEIFIDDKDDFEEK